MRQLHQRSALSDITVPREQNLISNTLVLKERSTTTLLLGTRQAVNPVPQVIIARELVSLSQPDSVTKDSTVEEAHLISDHLLLVA
jgi:hypothetical protein